MTAALLAFPGMETLAGRIGARLGLGAQPVDLHHFPDGESLVTLPGPLNDADVALVATLRDPDRLALPLRFAAQAARDLGARRVGLVAPYLAYMRQDRRFAPGQSVSAPIFARFLQDAFDWLVTVDPHLHRIAALDVLFDIPAVRIASAPLIAAWIAENLPDAVVLGPDSESQQWVAEVATIADRPYEVLKKLRSGDRLVDVSVPQSAALMQGTPVVVDDIASSGRTMARAVERLRAAGTRPPVCIAIHAVFAADAYREILAAGAARIVTTDTIEHPSNRISVGDSVAAAMVPFLLPQE